MAYSLSAACIRAKRLSSLNGGIDMYVVSEDGEYDTATASELDTFYLGANVEAHYFGGDKQ